MRCTICGSDEGTAGCTTPWKHGASMTPPPVPSVTWVVPLNGPGSHAWDLAEQRAQRERADRAEAALASALERAEKAERERDDLDAARQDWMGATRKMTERTAKAEAERDAARERAEKAEKRSEQLRGALMDTRWWGHSDAPQTWCWCEEDCGGDDHGCKSARAALAAYRGSAGGPPRESAARSLLRTLREVIHASPEVLAAAEKACEEIERRAPAGSPGTAAPPLPRRTKRRLSGEELRDAMDRLNPAPALEDYEDVPPGTGSDDEGGGHGGK